MRSILVKSSRATLAESLKGMIAEKAKANQKLSRGKGVKALPISANLKTIDTREEISKIAGVGHDTIHKVEYINQRAPDELQDLQLPSPDPVNVYIIFNCRHRCVHFISS